MLYFAKFCTLNSKYIHASIAPYYLSVCVNSMQNSALKASVFEGTVKQATTNINALADEILTDKPQFIGFSCYIWNIEKTLELAKVIRQKKGDVVICLGGPEVSYNAKEILQSHSCINYILAGEGEESVCTLLSVLLQNKMPKQGQISGLNTIEFQSPPCTILQSKELTNPYTNEYLNSLKGRIAYIETSRNCPYNCAFCLSGNSVNLRFYKQEQIFNNIITLSNSMAKTVKFIDRTFNASEKHANKILSFILENFGKSINEDTCFHFEIAGDILKESTMQILEKMPNGAVQLEIGMQSFNEKTLLAVRRKTDVQKLKQNIQRLVKSGNMHIHIDLIAGLPHENLNSFSHSFNTGYALNANVMQLGILKILHGSAMRSERENFPCTFNANPPYEITSTPWLSENDLQTLKYCEDALERIYNSGRFLLTAEYAIAQSNKTPFEFYCEIGMAARQNSIKTHHVDLDAYTKFLFDILSKMCNINKDLLRDCMIRDRLSTNAGARIPRALFVEDAKLAKASDILAKIHPRKKGIKRGVAMLYGCDSVCFVDYSPENKQNNRYKINEIALIYLFNKF